MTIEEAIKHCEEVTKEQEKAATEWHENQVRKCKLIPFAEMDYTYENNCKKCAEEHRQLAEWLKELKQYKEHKFCGDCISREEEHGTILKMLAEMDVKTLSIAYGYARCLLLYGVDVTEKWETVSQQTDMLEKAYKKGRDDVLRMMEGKKNNGCERTDQAV